MILPVKFIKWAEDDGYWIFVVMKLILLHFIIFLEAKLRVIFINLRIPTQVHTRILRLELL